MEMPYFAACAAETTRVFTDATAPSLYLLLFPCGMEDVVRDATLRTVASDALLAREVVVDVLSTPARKQVLASSHRYRGALRRQEKMLQRASNATTQPPAEQGSDFASPPQKCEKVCSAVDDHTTAPLRPRPSSSFHAVTSLRGALLIRVRAATPHAESLLLRRLGHERCIEQICLLLVSCPCEDAVSEVDIAVISLREAIRDTVLMQVGSLRASGLSVVAGEVPPIVGCGWPAALPLTDENVSFRVNCTRRDKSVQCSFTSQDLAAHVGGLLMELYESSGWRVNMLYHNVQFFVLHDQHHCHIAVAVTPPALPRCGNVIDISAQYRLELLRHRIASLLVSPQHCTDIAAMAPQLRALIPRPSSHRAELRWMKGDNAMHPALAAALVTYSAIEPHMTVLDPFAGSGTLLIEAWASVRFHPLHLLLGELHRKDAVRAKANLHHEHVTTLCSLHMDMPADLGRRRECVGHIDARDSNPSKLKKLKTEWMQSIVDDVASASISTLTMESAARCSSGEIAERLQSLRQWLGSHCFNCTVDVLHADATRTPLRSGSVDRIVSDIPFGRRCGTHSTNKSLYPALLRECHRLLRAPVMGDEDSDEQGGTDCWWRRSLSRRRGSGGRAVLLTIEGKLMQETLNELKSECPYMLVAEPFTLDMRGLFPFVFVLDKCV